MSNKLYGANVSDYLVEGSKDKGYRKNSGGGFGDGNPNGLVKNFDAGFGVNSSPQGWFEGKKSDKGTTVKR